MTMPTWVFRDGRWEVGTPAGAGLPPAGEPPFTSRPGGIRGRRYDAPSDSQIRDAVREDEPQSGFEETFHEAKRDLASGKLRVHPDALRSSRREIVRDGDAEVIVPASMAPPPAPLPARPEPEVPGCRIEPPREAAPLPGDRTISLKGQMRRGFSAIYNGDGESHRRRTV